MAQNPASTEHDGMPRSAMATGLVDYVLPPAEMPAQLMAYVARSPGRVPRPTSPAGPRDEDLRKKIFALLRAHTGHDFSQYKLNTIARRIERRMAVQQIDGLAGYVRALQKHPAEIEALFRDLLIGVTGFFRDPQAFAALEQQVLPPLLAQRPPGAWLRVWIAGCSTGEEAYSVAMLLQEQVSTLQQGVTLQIFATDIDSQAIAQARAGVYSASAVADIAPGRLDRFFTREQDGEQVRVHKSLRDLLVFSEHDLCRDPPFSKLDLVVCRNVLIYMGSALHKKLIPLFHYALKPGGFLFLGTSETTGDFVHLFAPVDRPAKLYSRRDDVLGVHRQPPTDLRVPLVDGPAQDREPAPGPRATLRELCERALLQHCAPAAALVNERGDILYLHGRTGQYLEPAPGEAGLNILKMAREGLRRELGTALHGAASHQLVVIRPGLKVKTNGDFSRVDLTVRPLDASPDSVATPGLLLVVLAESAAQETADPVLLTAEDLARSTDAGDEDPRLVVLRDELRLRDEHLQSTVEEMETANEELKSSNEELQSVNEELQSSNEELETSKEELQSVNEELATVNAELQAKVSSLSRANNDMNNLLAGTGVGTIFVDHALCIQRFTPVVTQVIPLIATDLGRPVGHIASNLVGYDRLVPDLQAVLDTLVPTEVEVQTVAGAWYLLRIRPYRTLDNVIEGAVITFTDITDVKKARLVLQHYETQQRLAVVLRDARDAITTHDLSGRTLAWNPAAEKFYGWSEAEALELKHGQRVPEQHRRTEQELLQRLARGEVVEPYRTQRLTRDGAVVEVWLTATALLDQHGQVYGVATTELKLP
ncbi:MAG: CheR family methyltransferase, partial [Pseudomonadota bacterium]